MSAGAAPRPLPAPPCSPAWARGWAGGGAAYALALAYLSPSPARGGPWAGSRVSHSVSPGTEQSQPVTFPPSTEPAFVTVPQRGFGEPFVLNPGAWTLLVEAEGVLLVRWGLSGWGPGPGPRASVPTSSPARQDYVVLLPSTYYEAALLQLRVTEACAFRPPAQRSGHT